MGLSFRATPLKESLPSPEIPCEKTETFELESTEVRMDAFDVNEY